MSIEFAPAAVRRDAHAPNDKLRAAAGEFAEAVARIWPRPHGPYFVADAPRRHLIHILAARTRDAEALARPLEGWSARRLIAAYLPEAPAGLSEALKRIDAEETWRSADYGRLLALLAAGGEAAKTVRHAPSLKAGELAALNALPDLLRVREIVTLVAGEAELVARAWRAALGSDPSPAAGRRLAEQLVRARTRDAIFSKLIDAIGERRIETGRVPGGDWLRPILGPKAMRAAAVRYENCLKDRIPMELSGSAAYYELVGAEPGVIEIVRDRRNNSWRFGEMRGQANRALSQEVLRRVEEHLVRHGVRPWGKAGALVQELAWAMAR